MQKALASKKTTISFYLSFVSKFCALWLLSSALVAFADHGADDHTLTAPVVNQTSNGNYTVTAELGFFSVLQEKVDAGSYAQVTPDSSVQDPVTYITTATKTYSSQPAGTYTYRVYSNFCFYTCSVTASEPVSVTVTATSAVNRPGIVGD